MTETPLLDRDERLGEAIEAYLALVEAGTPPDADDFAGRYPDLKDDLRAALDGLAMVQGLVGESGGGAGGRLEAGRRVAGYRIVRELGRGGMGIVYEAVHVDLDRPVALKVLGMHSAPDSTGRRRFLNEAKTAAGLHHTHIVPVFDVGQVGGLCYYAMQRIEGCGLDRVVKSLRKGRSTAAGSSVGRGRSKVKASLVPEAAAGVDLLSAASIGDATRSWFGTSAARNPGGPIPHDERSDEAPPFEPPRGSEYYRWVARAGHQAADALAHAHGRGVIHRDIKPSNLLVDGRGTVWVADFGLARRISDPSMTQTESLIGTPRYMSPEQAVQAPIDVLTDVYSLGATLYELLTLRPPHDGRSTAELIGQIRDKEPVSPRKLDPRLPRDLETIVLKAMGKRSVDRYASAGELAEDLQRFLSMEPVKARRISPVGRAWRFARRHPGLSAVSTIAAASILATATIGYVRVVQEKNKALRALDGEKTARHELKDAMIQNLWREAAGVRQMRVPDVRKTGLERLKEAVALKPDAAMTTKLRDEAVQLLAIRDIEPQPPLPTGAARGMAFAGSGRSLAILAEDGSALSVWSVPEHKATARYALSDAKPGDAREPGRGLPPWMGRFGSALASAGSTVAVPRPGGEGVRLFDVKAGGKPIDLAMPGHRVTDLYLTPDGRRLVTVEQPRFEGRNGRGPGAAGAKSSADLARVLLWDLKRPGSPLATLSMPEPKTDAPTRSRPALVAVSPDGKTIAAALWFDTAITLWATEDGTRTGEIATDGAVGFLALSADGTLAAASNGSVSRWDLRNLKPLPGLSLHQPFVNRLRFSPDGSMLAIAGPFNGVEIWDPEANVLLATIPTTVRVGDVTFSPDGRSLAATVPTATQVWDLVEPIGRSRLSAPETKPASHLFGLTFGPSGSLAATFGNRETASARVQCPSGAPTLREHLRTLAVGFDPAGRLVVPSGETLEFFASPRDESPARTARLPAAPSGDRPSGDALTVFGLLTAANGRTLALSRANDLVLVHFGEDGSPPILRSVRSGNAADPRAGEGPGRGRGQRKDKDKDAPSPPTGGPGPGPGPGPGGPRGFGMSFSLVLSAGGDRLYAVAGERSEPRVWTLEGDRAREIRWRVAHADVTRIAAHPDGRSVALGHSNGEVSIVSALDGTRLGSIPAPTDPDPVTALAYSRSGELAVGSRSGQIRLWSFGTESEAKPVVTLPNHQGEVKLLSYAPDGHRLAAGDDSGVDVWDLDQVRKRLVEIGLGW